MTLWIGLEEEEDVFEAEVVSSTESLAKDLQSAEVVIRDQDEEAIDCDLMQGSRVIARLTIFHR